MKKYGLTPELIVRNIAYLTPIRRTAMSSQDLPINVHHLTRVEGHGDIEVNLRNGAIEKCSWNVVEGPTTF